MTVLPTEGSNLQGGLLESNQIRWIRSNRYLSPSSIGARGTNENSNVGALPLSYASLSKGGEVRTHDHPLTKRSNCALHHLTRCLGNER